MDQWPFLLLVGLLGWLLLIFVGHLIPMLKERQAIRRFKKEGRPFVPWDQLTPHLENGQGTILFFENGIHGGIRVWWNQGILASFDDCIRQFDGNFIATDCPYIVFASSRLESKFPRVKVFVIQNLAADR